MKRGISWQALVSILIMAALVLPSHARERVKAWAGKITVPTYQLDPGDLNPRIQELDGSIIYPYTLQDEFTTKCVSQDHKAMFLENEYLKVTVLPDIGGRIHSVFDKTTNREMFHMNDCIRPARIALRGAWVSGGVEWNAGPQSHTVMAYDKLNAVHELHVDGSASIVVSHTQLDTGLRWQVRMTLRPGVAVLDEQIRIYNPTDAVHPYFFWNNTSFTNNGDGTRLIWPATLICDHWGTKFTRWPINDEGVDMTCMKNYQDTAAMFTVNCVYDFFGAYNSDSDRGMVQFADHRVLPGKKCWTWGKSNYGVMRQKFLGEKDTEYIEVQSGPLPTQSDYEFLDPHRQVAWEECWYPVHGLGEGFEYCTRELAVQTERPTAGDLKIRMLATAAYDQARVRVERDGAALAEDTADLNPKDVYSLSVPGGIGKPVRILVTAADGKVLADYTSPLPIPFEKIPTLAERTTGTAETCYLAGRRQDKNTDRIQARSLYEQALKLDPSHVGALRALAILDIEAARYDEALARLGKALLIEPADGQSRYFAAVCQLSSGRLDECLKQAYEAIRRPETRGLGWDISGRVYMRQGRLEKAIEAFNQALAADPSDLRAREHLLVATMIKKDIANLRPLADSVFVDDPTNVIGWYAETVGMKVRMATPGWGYPDNEALNAAAMLAEIGCYAQAQDVITRVCGKKPENRLVLYWLAWLAERQGQTERADQLRLKAAAAPTEGVYPCNPLDIAVLQEAIKLNPNDASATADLGNYLGGLGRLADAAALWETAVKLDPSQAVAWRNLGLYEWKSNKDLKAAERCYAAAVKANPSDQTYWRDQATVLMQDKRPADAAKLLKSMPLAKGAKPRGDLLLTIVRADLKLGRYDDAVQILTENWLTVGEFQTDSHELFVRALVARGERSFNNGNYKAALADFERALTYPDNLGIGRRSHPSEAIQYYWIGKSLQKLGRNEEAVAAWKTGSRQVTGRAGSTREQGRYIRLCADQLK
ncbi:MAG: DUF5107 domain-containing protein [Candidatus Sumerlaeia bacterium]